MWFWSLLTVFAAGGDLDIDVRTIPADQRIAYVNKIADRVRGRNAAKYYREATDASVYVFELTGAHRNNGSEKAYDQFDNDDVVLAVRLDWTADEARIADEWLEANGRALRALRRASRLRRCYEPIPDSVERLSNATNVGDGSSFLRLVSIMGVEAARCARQEDWDQAYQWVVRTRRMAAHVAQSPFPISHLQARAVERRANTQFLAFMRVHPAGNAPALLEKMIEFDEFRMPDEVVEFTDGLWTWDHILAWHEWAGDPESHPELGSMLETLFDPEWAELGEGAGSILTSSPFASPEQVRDAIKRTTPEADWKILERATQLSKKWHEKEFHAAWAEADAHHQQYCDIYLKAPSLAVYGCAPMGTTFGRQLAAVTEAHGAAVECVVALHECRRKTGKWPEKLEALVPGFLATVPPDPFTGRPLVYRLTDGGKDFVLYSAGSDQDDDGGRHTSSPMGEGDFVYWPPVIPERYRPE